MGQVVRGWGVKKDCRVLRGERRVKGKVGWWCYNG
jgi:hypothetical protein